MRRRKVLGVSALGLLGMLLCGCDFFSNSSSQPLPFSALTRRLYVNDSAANDSLPAALTKFGTGVKFVLHPNQNYTLRLTTAAAGDSLQLYKLAGSYLKYWITLPDSAKNGVEFFNMRSDEAAETGVFGLLRTTEGATAGKRISHVRLLPVNPPAASSALAVHLFVVGKFKTIADADRAAYASQFLTELKLVYAGYGVTLTTSYEIIDTARVSMPFSDAFVNLPGTRIAHNAHLYLVDSIYQATASSSQILGYAPREVVNIDVDPDSRVILSSRVGSAVKLATTAAHELGHFLGMRHPTTTSNDRQSDDDQSNVEDGLASTSVCSDMILSKRSAAAPSFSKGPNGKQYCLFTAGAPSECPSTCNLSYLMFAYYCSATATGQRTLTSEQQAILRQNLALLQK